MRIPGLGSPDWVTLDSVTSNNNLYQCAMLQAEDESCARSLRQLSRQLCRPDSGLSVVTTDVSRVLCGAR